MLVKYCKTVFSKMTVYNVLDWYTSYSKHIQYLGGAFLQGNSYGVFKKIEQVQLHSTLDTGLKFSCCESIHLWLLI